MFMTIFPRPGKVMSIELQLCISLTSDAHGFFTSLDWNGCSAYQDVGRGSKGPSAKCVRDNQSDE